MRDTRSMESIKSLLLTSDGVGMVNKNIALDEIIRRELAESSARERLLIAEVHSLKVDIAALEVAYEEEYLQRKEF